MHYLKFQRLGSMGRLGNQMFQYASLRGIAHANNMEWMIPDPVELPGMTDYSLFNGFTMETVGKRNRETRYDRESRDRYTINIKADGFHFCSAMMDFKNHIPTSNYFEDMKVWGGDINLDDYLQSYKYFEAVDDIIRKDFTFLSATQEACAHKIDSNAIFLHVRRGDYLAQPQNHPVCTIEYYERALQEFPNDTKVFVFSDDLEWCKEHFTDSRFVMENENSHYIKQAWVPTGMTNSAVPFHDLYIMTQCKGGIISNSTLSWWGAYLISNNDKKIVSPFHRQWFGPALSHLNTEDLIPNDWVEIVY